MTNRPLPEIDFNPDGKSNEKPDNPLLDEYFSEIPKSSIAPGSDSNPRSSGEHKNNMHDSASKPSKDHLSRNSEEHDRLFKTDMPVEQIKKAYLDMPPTKEEIKEAKQMAQKRLENEDLYKLLSKTDQEALQKLQIAILDGNFKTLHEIRKQFAKNPEKFNEFLKYLEKNLREEGSDINLEPTKDGRIFVFRDNGHHAVEVGADGKVKVRAIKTYGDSGRSMDVRKDLEPIRPKVDELSKKMGEAVVRGILNPVLKDYSGEPTPDIMPWPNDQKQAFPDDGMPPTQPKELPDDNESKEIPNDKDWNDFSDEPIEDKSGTSGAVIEDKKKKEK